MASINFEIRIDGPNYGFREKLTHPDETGIGEIHGSIRVFAQELPDGGGLLLKKEIAAEQSIRMPSGKRFPGSGNFRQQMQTLRQHGFTGQDWWENPLEAAQRPSVVMVGSIQQCHESARIHQKRSSHLRPNPSKWLLLEERSPNPLAPMCPGSSKKRAVTS